MKWEVIINKTKVKILINTSLRSKLYKAYNEKLCFSIVVYSYVVLINIAKNIGYIVATVCKRIACNIIQVLCSKWRLCTTYVVSLVTTCVSWHAYISKIKRII